MLFLVIMYLQATWPSGGNAPFAPGWNTAIESTRGVLVTVHPLWAALVAQYLASPLLAGLSVSGYSPSNWWNSLRAHQVQFPFSPELYVSVFPVLAPGGADVLGVVA